MPPRPMHASMTYSAICVPFGSSSDGCEPVVGCVSSRDVWRSFAPSTEQTLAPSGNARWQSGQVRNPSTGTVLERPTTHSFIPRDVVQKSHQLDKLVSLHLGVAARDLELCNYLRCAWEVRTPNRPARVIARTLNSS